MYFDERQGAVAVKLADGLDEFLLSPATVRRNDTSATSINEWTGEGRRGEEERRGQGEPVPAFLQVMVQRFIFSPIFRTGQRTIRDEDVPEGIKPLSINPLGNYAVQVSQAA